MPYSSHAHLSSDDAHLLEKWNDTEAPVDKHSLVDHFRSQVHKRGSALALVAEGTRLSYRQLADRAAQLAHHLLAQGARPEDVVAINMDRSAEMIVAILASLMAGTSFVPVDPHWPKARRHTVHTTAGTVFVLTREAQDYPDAIEVKVTVANWEYAHYPTEFPNITLHPTQRAYIIFTSGSTGTPKGAMILHEAINARLQWQIRELLHFGADYSEHDVALFKAPLSFDISINEILLPLMSGATLVVAKPLGDKDPHYLLDLIVREKITYLYLVSTMLDVLVELAQGTSALASVKHVWCGGEILTPELYERFRQASKATMYHGYGPAEATIGVSHVIYQGNAHRDGISIGRPNPNTQLYVLDEQLELVPPGETGELYAAGLLLGRGYVGAPGLSAARFIAHPFHSGTRLYRTGDLARWRHDGTLEFMGRADNQVKIRGQRLELEEIESVLTAHPQVRHSCVILTQGPHNVDHLAGYVVLATPGSISGEDLRSWLAEQLPEYMVPTAIKELDRFPITDNGKLDRKALPSIFDFTDSAAGSDTDAINATEEQLCALFAEITGFTQCTVQDDFFSLGGDSIQAIRLVTKARNRGIELSTIEVYQLRTPKALAEYADNHAQAAKTEIELPSEPINGTPIIQWLAHRGDTISGFIQAMVLTPPPAMASEAAAQDFLNYLVARHPILGSSLRDNGGSWAFDHTSTPAAPWFEVVTESVNRDSLSDHESVARACQALNPAGGVMLAGVWFTSGYLYIIVHHSVIDAVSWHIIAHDIEAYSSGDIIAENGYLNWSYALKQATEDGWFNPDSGHWLALGEHVLSLDYYFKDYTLDPACDTVATESVYQVLLPAAVSRFIISQAPGRCRASINDILLTALVLSLQDLDNRGLYVLMEGHGRQERFMDPTYNLDLSTAVGWFTTFYPVFIPAAPEPNTLISTLKQVKDRLNTTPSQGLSWGALEYFGPDEFRKVAQQLPGPPVLFNYLGASTPETHEAWSLDHPDPKRYLGEQRDSRMPLPRVVEINAMLNPDGQLSTTFSVPERLFTQDELAQLGQRWIAALENIAQVVEAAETIGRSVSDFPLVKLTQTEVDHLDGPDVVTIVPLTPLQEGLYFHSIFDETSSGSYVEQIICTFEGAIDADILRRASHELLVRYPNLGATFEQQEDAGLVSIWRGHTEVPVTVVTLPDDHVSAFLTEDNARGFDLTQGPLWRLSIVNTDQRNLLIITIHHLILDGWSMPIVLSELCSLYGAYSNHQQPQLAQPADYLAFVRWLQEQSWEASATAWQHYLHQAQPTHLAPLQYGEPGQAIHTEQLQRSIAGNTLAQHARDHNCTVGDLAALAWAVTLADFTGNTSPTFGTVTSGRGIRIPNCDPDSLVGLTLCTIPLTISLAGSIGEVIEQHQKDQLNLLNSHHYGLQNIHKVASFSFDTLLVADTTLDPALLNTNNSTFSITEITTHEAVHYPIVLHVHDSGTEQMRIRLVYDTDRIAADYAEKVVEKFAHTLTAFEGAALDQPIGALIEPYTTINPEARFTGTLSSQFIRIAQKYPDRIAVSSSAETVSYGQLLSRCLRFAQVLRDQGIDSEATVGVATTSGSDLIISLLAVVLAGACYVPIDVDYPQERIAYIIADSACDHIICSADSSSFISAISEVNIIITQDFTADNLPENSSLPAHIMPHNAAYIIYTSGSTGKPKGVQMTHASVIELFNNTESYYHFSPEDSWTLFHSASFDFSVWEIWGPLLTGGRMVIVAKDIARNSEEFLNLLHQEKITIVNQTPTAFYTLLDTARSLATFPKPGSVSTIIFGGEALDFRRLRPYDQVFNPGTRLINMYGITETCVHVSYYPVPIQDISSSSSSIIGEPIGNLRILILDDKLNLCPPHTPGEMYITGGQLARGYFHNPALTSTRFIANPYYQGHDPAYLRLYRTGDVAAWRADGLAEFVGRSDDQVKIRGHRIELGEIEHALESIAGVQAARVLAREDIPGHKQLAAYIIASNDIVPAQIVEELNHTLPAYMVPQNIIRLEAFPITMNGKLDVQSLPKPEASPAAAEESGNDSLTSDIIAIMNDVLHTQAIAADTDFFTAGGDSIIAMAVVNQARRKGFTLTPRHIFTHRTARALAEFLAESQQDSPIEHAQDGIGEIQLMPIMVRLHELGGPIDHFHQATCITLPGNITLEEVDAALGTLYKHHDALRARLTVTPLYDDIKPDEQDATNTVWAMTIDSTCPTQERVKHYDIATNDTEKLRKIANETVAQLAPQAGVMLRCALISGYHEHQLLYIACHHCVIDGISWHILIEDIITALQNPQQALPPVPVSLRHAAQEIINHAHDPLWTNTMNHWLATLQPGALLFPEAIPGDSTTIALRETQDYYLLVDPDITRYVLDEAPAKLDVGITELLLAALRVALTRANLATGDVLIDVERHGRDVLTPFGSELDISRTLGWFTAIAPMRIPTFSDLKPAIEYLKNQSVGALADAFGSLAYQNPRSAKALRKRDRPDVLFNYMGRSSGYSDEPWKVSALENQITVPPDPALRSPYALELNVICLDSPQGSQLRLHFTYARTIGEATVENIATTLESVLGELQS